MPWFEGQVYGSTPGAALNSSINVGDDYDAARANLGVPWRLPTSGEYEELFSNIDYLNADGSIKDDSVKDKRSTVFGIVGIWLQSKINGNRIFFPCSGYGHNTSWGVRGSEGNYWSATFGSPRNARSLYFGSSGVATQGYSVRSLGFTVRAVKASE